MPSDVIASVARPRQSGLRARIRHDRPMDLLFEFATLGLLLSGYLAMLSTGSLDLITSIAVCAASLYRAVSLIGFLPRRMPGWLIGVLTVAGIALYPADALWWSGDFIQATVHLIFFFALLKLLSAQGNRDHLILLALSFLLVVVAAILSSDSLYFIFLLGFLTFSVVSFTSLELRRSIAGRKVAQERMRRLPLRLTFVSLLISGGIAAMSLGLFYALPRTAGAALNQFLLRRPGTPGFAREMILGRYGELTRNPAVVMRIREIPLDGASAPFPTHWRGATLTRFDGKRWSSPDQPGELIRVHANEVSLASPAQRRQPGLRGGYEVHVSSQLGELLFLPGLAEFLRIEQSYLFRYPDRTLRLPLNPRQDLEYAAFSYFDNEWELARGKVATLSGADLGAPQTEDLLYLPTVDPRIAELARSITEGYDTPLDKARILSSYLRGNYHYSLGKTRPGGADPLARFLFETREGHCEYFASALAVMLRTLRIPSRIATGFLVTEFNPLTGWHLARMSDAHSWVEVWLPGRGWFGFDPTPSSRQRPMSQVLTHLRQWRDAADTFWQDWVLTYDLGRQLTLAGSVGAANRGVRDLAARTLSALEAPAAARSAGWILSGFACLLASFWLWRSRLVRVSRRMRRPLAFRHASDDEAARIYAKALRSLATRGYVKPAWQTSTEFAESLAGFAGMRWFKQFTEDYHEARYGGMSEALTRLRRLSAEPARIPKR